MSQPSTKEMEIIKASSVKTALAFVDGLKEVRGRTKSWVCGGLCGAGCGAGCAGGCGLGCAADGPIPVGDAWAATGAGGAGGGVASGAAEGL